MIKRLYRWIYHVTSRADERGEYSGGCLEGAVREEALGLCGPNGKVLEIGCGAGLFVLKLATISPGTQIWGVDNNAAMVDGVRKKAEERCLGNLALSTQDARSLSFEEGTFDKVVCINLSLNTNLELLAALLKEMKRVCKRSGSIIFDYRSSRNLLFVLKYKLAKYYDPTAPYPLYTHNPEEIESVLKELGLEVAVRRYLGFPWKCFAPIIIIEARKV